MGINDNEDFIIRPTKKDGEVIFQKDLPSSHQGFSHRLDYKNPLNPTPPQGPFSVIFVLTNSFVVYKDDLDKINLNEGFSNFKLGESFEKERFVYCDFPDDNGDQITAKIGFGFNDNYLTRIAVMVGNEELNRSTAIAYGLISFILDSLAFIKKTPIGYYKILVIENKSGHCIREMFTQPYNEILDINHSDFFLSQTAPFIIRPLFKMYREAINSTNPYYRFLCLYKIHEGLENKIKPINNKKAAALSNRTKRNKFILDDNDVTRAYYPELIGKAITLFYDKIRNDFRINIAHFNFDDFEKLIIDPTNVYERQKIDYTNYILLDIIRKQIKEEIKYIGDNDLEKADGHC